MHTLINGLPASTVSAWDRGFLYGDGVFRTLRIRDGQPVWWQDHLDKLALDCQRLDLPVVERSDWERDLAQLVPRLDDAVLRLVVTRGEGVRGYQPPPRPVVTRLVMTAPSPAPDSQLETEGLRLRLCDLRLGLQPRLAGIKHLNRLENILARQEWQDPSIHEGLLFDTEDRLISAVQGNVFLIQPGRIVTPRLDRCGVAGVARQRLLAGAPGWGVQVMEADLGRDDLEQAEGVLISNSVMGLRWAGQVDGRTYPRPAVLDALREAMHGQA